MKVFQKITNRLSPYLCAAIMLPLGSVVVDWDPSPQADVKGYRLYYGFASSETFKTVDVGNVTEYTLDDISEDSLYYFIVTAYDNAGNESRNSEAAFAMIPSEGVAEPIPLTASYNFPNPFRAGKESTHIRYNLMDSGPVTIEVFDISNNLIRRLLDGTIKTSGEHIDDVWDGKDENGGVVSNGVYFCRIRTGQYTHVIKIAVVN